MDAVKSIQLHTCHLQYVHWVTGMTYDALDLEKDRKTTIPFVVRSNEEASSLCVTSDSIPEHKCE